jgi:hypothetical protein
MTAENVCDVCERIAPSDDHPCAFAVACSCWQGEPCDGMGAEPVDVNAYSVASWSPAFRAEAIAAVLESRR